MNAQEMRKLAKEGALKSVDRAIKQLENIVRKHAEIGLTSVIAINEPYHGYGYTLVGITLKNVPMIESYFNNKGFEVYVYTDEEDKRLDSLHILWGLKDG